MVEDPVAGKKPETSGAKAEKPETGGAKAVCFFVLGGPGSGKGTNCARLVQEHGFVHLSSGDLLRAERDSGSPDGELINNHILEGKMVPGDLVINLIKKAMKNAGWASKKFLIDGFPRSAENKEGWDRIMGEEVDMKFVLFLECSEDNLIERITARAEAAALIGAPAREDDNIDVMKKRFAVFREQSVPIVELYEKKNMVKRIDANGSSDDVWNQVAQAFNGHL